MHALGIACLRIGQAGKLLGISEDKLDLATRSIIVEEDYCIQLYIGGEEQSLARFVRIAPVDHDDHAQGRLSETWFNT